MMLWVDKSRVSDFLNVLKLFDFVKVEAPAMGDHVTDEYEDNMTAMEIAQFQEVIEMSVTPENFVSHEEVKLLVQQRLNRKG